MASGSGTARENELVRLLDALGFAVIRSPSSGSRTDREQPDVLAARGGTVFALESKYGDPPSNLGQREVSDLSVFAEEYDAITLGAFRYKRDKSFYLVRPADLDRTKSGNYSVPSDPERLAWVVRLQYDGTGKATSPTELVDWTGDVLTDATTLPDPFTDFGDLDDVDQMSLFGAGGRLANWFDGLGNDRAIDFDRESPGGRRP